MSTSWTGGHGNYEARGVANSSTAVWLRVSVNTNEVVSHFVTPNEVNLASLPVLSISINIELVYWPRVVKPTMSTLEGKL